MMGDGSEPTEISEADVLAKIGSIGYGSLPIDDWKHLIKFRLFNPKAHATLLIDSLSHVCNGRAKSPSSNYAVIHGLHPKRRPWPKVFYLMELYCGSLMEDDEDTAVSTLTEIRWSDDVVKK